MADNILQSLGRSAQNGPFTEMLTAQLPPPTPTTQPSGWEGGAAAALHLGSRFLKGVQERRVTDFVRQQVMEGQQRERFLDIVRTTASDPNLTEAARSDIIRTAMQTLGQQVQEAGGKGKGKDGGGIGGLFKNILVEATGGPFPKSKPVDFAAAIGNITLAATDPAAKQEYWLGQASAGLDQVKKELEQQKGIGNVLFEDIAREGSHFIDIARQNTDRQRFGDWIGTLQQQFEPRPRNLEEFAMREEQRSVAPEPGGTPAPPTLAGRLIEHKLGGRTQYMIRDPETKKDYPAELEPRSGQLMKPGTNEPYPMEVQQTWERMRPGTDTERQASAMARFRTVTNPQTGLAHEVPLEIAQGWDERIKKGETIPATEIGRWRLSGTQTPPTAVQTPGGMTVYTPRPGLVGTEVAPLDRQAESWVNDIPANLINDYNKARTWLSTNVPPALRTRALEIHKTKVGQPAQKRNDFAAFAEGLGLEVDESGNVKPKSATPPPAATPAPPGPAAPPVATPAERIQRFRRQ